MLFCRIFRYIRDRRLCALPAQEKDETFWNPKRGGLLAGIKRLADLKRFLPIDYHQTLGALICYRNAMFHNGLEWREEECTEFQTKMQQNEWQVGWFIEMNLCQDSRMFSMQPEFIEHCLDTIDKVIYGFWEFVRNRQEHSKKRP